MSGPTGEHRAQPPAPPRLWTVEEANSRLPALNELLPQLKAWVIRLKKVHDELQRLATFWGKEVDASDHPDHGLKIRLDQEWKTVTHKLERAVTSLQEEGIEVKDLETGLLDFYGRHDGEVIFLCWQRGEDEVAFYHTLEGGYRSRRPIPDAFRRAMARPRGSP